MRKGLLAICLSLVVVVVLLAVLVPGCAYYPPCKGTIEVNATICGFPWPGVVNYTLSGLKWPLPNDIINGASVPATHSGALCLNWTCLNVSGGPPGAFLADIAPSAHQTVSDGGTITFTLNFEKDQDAAIECLYWTVDGNETMYPVPELHPCQILDVHFQQWVDGCTGYNVTLNETSWLNITQIGGPFPATIFVVNASCALNKTPDEPLMPTPVKNFQVSSFNGTPVEVGMNTTLVLGVPTLLGVETQWQLVKALNYTKSINWLGIWSGNYVPGLHPCVLFELVVPPNQTPQPVTYVFTVQASAKVALVDGTDVNPVNNEVVCSALNFTVYLPEGI
jgi:hypothetical protein